MSYFFEQLALVISEANLSFSSCLVTILVISLSILLMIYYKAKGSCCGPLSVEEFKLSATTFKGNCATDSPLAPCTRFRVGGPAEILFRPVNFEQLVTLLKLKPKEFPTIPIGMGSNVLVRDGGIPGLVIQIVGRGFAQFDIRPGINENEKIVEVGAGMSQLKFAKLCAKAGISGLEFFCGIPGTIGGALRMNAGAHGTEVSDRLINVTVLDPNNVNEIHKLTTSELAYSYRNCGLPKNWIFISAIFKGDYLLKSREEIELRIQEMLSAREESQPVNEKTAGCTFANPIHTAGFDQSSSCSAAWELIVDAGCAGKRIGDAEVSTKHANFLINTNSATAEELESLGEYVQEKVLDSTGIELRWEVERIGIRKSSEAKEINLS